MKLMLPDGRTLAVAEHGAAQDRPVLYFHASPGSRLERRWGDEALRERGLRLISFDRPGIGGSTACGWRPLSATAGDAAAILDALGIDRVAVMGFSAGCAWAMAFAQACPERVEHLVLLSSVAPFHGPGVREAIPEANRALFETAVHAPAALAERLRPATASPEAMVQAVAASCAPVDRSVFADCRFADSLRESLAESVAQGIEPFVSELASVAGDWGFSLSEVDAPATIWHGTADGSIPLAMAHYLEAKLPQGRLKIVPGEGHYFSFGRWGEILDGIPAPRDRWT